MGRRSMKTTKGGRFMNPTDQARKEARRKELKKNKKQRQIVREAVIKSKEPRELLRELEELEQQDMESSLKGLPNEKGIKERKKKLQDTVHRLQVYWEKESPAQFHDLKRLVRESEERRRRMKQTYAFSSSIADTAEQRERLSLIPLPSDSVPADTLPEDIPLPEPDALLPPAILKPAHASSRYPYPLQAHLIQERNAHLPRKPPGPPPGLPPALLRRQKPLGLTEIDLLNKATEKKVSFAPITELDGTAEADSQPTRLTPQYASIPPPAPLPPPTGYSSLLPPSLLSAPPPLRSSFLLPPSIPSSAATPFKGPGLQPHFQASAVLNAPQLSATSTAPPLAASLSARTSSSIPPPSVISAKPQLRDTYAEVTKFVPTSIRVRRDAAISSPGTPAPLSNAPPAHSYGLTYSENKAKPVRTQDEAYSDFMKEMELLL